MARPTREQLNPALTSQSFETTLESLWDALTDLDKAFIIAFPHFDSYADTARFVGKPPSWYYLRRQANKHFRKAVIIRHTTSHEAAMSLLKMDIAAKALAQTAIDIHNHEIDAKELRGLVKTMTGKVKESKGPARQGNLVDLRSVNTWEDEDDEDTG